MIQDDTRFHPQRRDARLEERLLGRELLRDEDGHVSRGDACENERKGLARGTRCAPCE